MDISAAQLANTTTTAALAQQMNAQQTELAMLLKTLEEMQQMQLQMMQSLGKALNVDVSA